MQNAVFSDSVLRIYGKLLFVFALLVSNAAGCFASRLTRSLAFAAAAVVYGFNDIFGFDGFNSGHGKYLRNVIISYSCCCFCAIILSQKGSNVKNHNKIFLRSQKIIFLRKRFFRFLLQS